MDFVEAVYEVLSQLGTELLNDPQRFRGAILDLCHEETPQLSILERNCDAELLSYYIVACSKKTTRSLDEAVHHAQQLLVSRQINKDAAELFCSDIATAIAKLFNIPAPPIPSDPLTARPDRTWDAKRDVHSTTGPNRTWDAKRDVHSTTGPDQTWDAKRDGRLTTGSGQTWDDTHGGHKRFLAPVLLGAVLLMALIAVIVLTAVERDDIKSDEAETITNSADTDVTQEEETPMTCEVSFVGAGADSGTMEPIDCEVNESIVVPKCAYVRDGYTFECWVDEQGKEYEPGDAVTVTKNLILTAKWSTEATVDQPQDNNTEETSSQSQAPAVTTQDSHPTEPPASSTTQDNSPFWGVWTYASKSYDECEAYVSTVRAEGFDARVYYTTDWANLNSEPWYVVTLGTCASKEEAQQVLDAAFNHGYSDAYVKYSGAHT